MIQNANPFGSPGLQWRPVSKSCSGKMRKFSSALPAKRLSAKSKDSNGSSTFFSRPAKFPESTDRRQKNLSGSNRDFFACPNSPKNFGKKPAELSTSDRKRVV